MDEKLREAYATALKHAHGGGRVEIHMGIHVVEYLRLFCTQEGPQGSAPTMWGFPIRVRDSFPPEHIEVHVVHTIY